MWPFELQNHVTPQVITTTAKNSAVCSFTYTWTIKAEISSEKLVTSCETTRLHNPCTTTLIFTLLCTPQTKSTERSVRTEDTCDRKRLSEVNYLTTELNFTPIPDSLRCLSISSQQSPEPTVKNTWNGKSCPSKSTFHSYTQVSHTLFDPYHTHLVILTTCSWTPNCILYFQFFKYHLEYLEHDHLHI